MSDAQTLFVGKPASAAIHDRVLQLAAGIGPFQAAYKTGSVHLNRRSAFAGLHPRSNGLLLVIRTSQPLESARVRKREQVSANRWHNEVLLESPASADDEVVAWLSEAYRLSA